MLLTNEPTWPESSADNRTLRDAKPRNGVPAALVGTEFVARIKGQEQGREEQSQLGFMLVDRHLFLDRPNV
nr:putative integron gene cassette protein [uncultured bacterium]